GLLAGERNATTVESKTVVIVEPARDARTQVNPAYDNERYVQSQLRVLRSEALAGKVASALADGTTAADLLSSVRVSHVPETDVVEVVATADDAGRARLVAETYASTYLSTLQDRIDST